MTTAEAMRLLAMIKFAYPRQEFPPDSVKVYGQFLLDLDFASAEAAVTQHIATDKWPPAISDIRTVVARAEVDAPDSGDAWQEVLEKVRSCGRYRVPVFSHPAIDSAVANLGWEEICNSPSDSASERARFLEFFKQAETRQISAANTKALTAPSPRWALRDTNTVPLRAVLAKAIGVSE